MSDDEEPYLRELDSCSFCKDRLSLNSGLKILITPCGHTICQPCMGSSFRHQKMLTCKGCLAVSTNACTFRKEDLIPTDGEDPYVRKEMKARYKVYAIYNKREADFAAEGRDRMETMKLYNEYLDHVEHMVYRLTNNIDVELIEEEMAKYKEDNVESIHYNEGLKKNKESIFGGKLLPWQIAPEKSLHWKEPVHIEARVPTPPPAPFLQPPPQAMQRMAVAQAPALAAQEFVCSFVNEDKSNRNLEQAKVAGGYDDRFRKERDKAAAIFGLRSALQRFSVR